MTAPVQAAEAEAAEVEAEEVEVEVEAEEAEEVEAEEVEEAVVVLPSQGHLFAAALPLPVRPPRSAQRLPVFLPLRLYLLPWPPVSMALLRAR